MNSIDRFVDQCLNPGKEYTPIPFWFLNDELFEEELARQLKDFSDKGVNGVVVHPRIGLPESLIFLSDEYFSKLRFIAAKAKELGMVIVLYDEAMYPSGSAHGLVVASNIDFTPYGIVVSDNYCNCDDIDYDKSRCVDDCRVIAEKDGRFILEKRSPGTIRGIHFGEDDGEPNAPKAADLLNPASVDKFIELVHDTHFNNLKEYFGSTIIGFFTDEPDPLGRNAHGFRPWQKGMDTEILAAGGDLDELFEMFDDKNANNPTIAIYRKMIVDKLNNIYYKRLYDWCKSHGVSLMGHPAASDDIDEMQYFHIPGQDLVFRWVSPEKGGCTGPHSMLAKCSADGARHLGRRRNSNECFGVCVRDNVPWYFTGKDMKWFIDWLGVRGVNMFIPHAFYYSLREQRKHERPPDVGPGNIWWQHYKHWSDYMKRISYVMTDSVNAAEIAVLCESGNMAQDAVKLLYENQIEFNYLAKSFLTSHPITDGNVTIGSYTYKHLLDADRSCLSEDVASLINTIERDFETDVHCSDLRVSHIIKDGIDMYFVFNEANEMIDTGASIPLHGALIAVDLWRGHYFKLESERCAEKTRFTLHLKPGQTLLLIVDKENNSTVNSSSEVIDLGDLTGLFKFVSEDTVIFSKKYTASLHIEKVSGNEVFYVNGEEMVECYINGEFAGVSFSAPHEYKNCGLLRQGHNEIQLVMTGNAANIYGDVLIPYGIL